MSVRQPSESWRSAWWRHLTSSTARCRNLHTGCGCIQSCSRHTPTTDTGWRDTCHTLSDTIALPVVGCLLSLLS